MRRLTIAAALLLAASGALAQQRFSNASLNFSFMTPGASWQWRALPELAKETAGGGVWVVRNERGEQFSVSVAQSGARKVDERWMHDLLNALEADAARHGDRIDRFHFEPATSPVFPSYRYAYTRIAADGTPSFVDGYVAAVSRLYTMQYASKDRRLAAEFTRFVGSFAVVDKFERLRGSSASDPARFPGIQAIGLDSRLGRPITPNGDPWTDEQP